jgi:hypothetical protein
MYEKPFRRAPVSGFRPAFVPRSRVENEGFSYAPLARIAVMLIVAGLGWWYYLSREDKKRE